MPSGKYTRRLRSRDGDRNGKLVVQHRDGVNKWNQNLWAVLCDCGNTIRLTASGLKLTQSCGCAERAKALKLRESVVLPEPELGVVYVPLTKGQFARLDESEFHKVSPYLWAAWWNKGTGTYYAVAHTKNENGVSTKIYMHRLILEPRDGLWTDHIDRDETLDNRISNLRYATPAENGWNAGPRSTNTSGFKGVTLDKRSGKWIAQISVNGKHYYLGLYASKEEAYAAYCVAALKYHGKFARLA